MRVYQVPSYPGLCWQYTLHKCTHMYTRVHSVLHTANETVIQSYTCTHLYTHVHMANETLSVTQLLQLLLFQHFEHCCVFTSSGRNTRQWERLPLFYFSPLCVFKCVLNFTFKGVTRASESVCCCHFLISPDTPSTVRESLCLGFCVSRNTLHLYFDEFHTHSL